MNVDERDTKLGDVLDRAVRGIEAAGEPGAVERRGSRRRAGVLVASVTAVGVFLGAVAFAATQVGRDARDPADLGAAGTFASPDFRWTMPIPAGWRSGAARAVGGPAEMLPDLRTSFVTTSLTASFTGPVTVGSPLPPGIVSSDVIVIVDPFVGTGESHPTTFVPNAEREDIENPGWTWRDGRICGETGCARVYIWHGPDANATDLVTALGAAQGVRVVPSPPDPSALTPEIDYRDGEDGFSMTYPAGWTVADENLTPLLASPHEILSVGTYPLRPGGKAPIDAYLPKNALADLGADDVFITVQETDSEPGPNSTRPSAFTPASVCDAGDPACRDGSGLGLEGLRAWWIPFSDPSSGRSFYAFVAMGEAAYGAPARADAAWAILDSLEFDPGDTPVAYPVPSLSDYDFVPVEGGGLRIWPRSGPADVGVHYRFEVGHCGLTHITDFDGSFWQPVLRHPVGPDSPSVLINADRGSILMSDPGHAIYTASTGQEVVLLRVQGPVVVRTCN
jgi:hypothetical protein